MEYGSIERELQIDATPDVVYQVVSSPEHLREWWPDEVELDPVPDGVGVLRFGSLATDGKVVPLTVVEAEPSRRFSFRWVYDEEVPARATSSLLVTFDLIPSGAGTLLRVRETGFREKGWEVAVLEEQYREHVTGWDYFLPRLVSYAARLASTP
jgi:uncharacterized protein YndB with AHSA1/START domain